MNEKTANENEADQKEAVNEIARETMTGDIRDCILDFLKHNHNSLPWNAQGEMAQNDIIEKATKAGRYAAERAVKIISSDNRPTIVAQLKKVTVTDDIKAELVLSKSDPMRHNLFDSQGLSVLVIVTDSAPYDGERKPVKAKPDQTNLLPGEDDDGDDTPVFDNTPSGRH